MFFNMQNNNKAVKNGEKVLLQNIAENRKFFVPMLARTFNLQESKQYDNLTDESLEEILKNPQKIDLDQNPRNYLYHTDKDKFDDSKQVKIRLLCPFKLEHINWEKRTV